jgi:hypothetical protein
LAIGGALAGATGLALPKWQTRGRAISQRGIVGGGLAQFESGEANFSLFASRLIVDGEEPGGVLGRVRWVDATAGLTLTSVSLSDYLDIQIADREGEARRLIGELAVEGAEMTGDGAGPYPFVLEAVDAGTPGTGLDMVSLFVGEGVVTETAATPAADTGFRYNAAGMVVLGDLQVLDFEVAVDGGVVIVATPEA